jgi:hypothetical protein
MITPTEIPLTIYTRSAFDQGYDFWADTAHTQPYDFTPWAVTATLISASLSNSEAFDVDVEGGVVTLSLSEEETAALNDTVRTTYAITVTGTEGSPGGPYYIVKGEVTVVDVA